MTNLTSAKREVIFISIPKTRMYENICFSGGGIKTLSFAGAIKVLEKRGLLQGINRFAGSSAGSMFATLLACKFSAEEIIKLIDETDISELAEEGFGQNLWRLAFKFGFYSGGPILKWIENMFRKKGLGKYTTFIEVYEKFGSELIITGTNLNRQKTVYYSPCRTPRMSIMDAIRISTSIPLFIQPVNIEGDLYGDGGLLCNYPIHIFRSIDPKLEKTIGFYARDTKECTSRHKFENLIQFVDIVISGIREQSQHKYRSKRHHQRTIFIDTYHIGATHFNLNEETKKKLFKWGKLATEEWLDLEKRLEAVD